MSAVALVNSAAEPDTLTTTAELTAFLDAQEFSGTRRGDEAELRSVRDLRPRLRALMTSDRDTAAGLVNDLLLETRALPQLMRHDALDWHVHAVDQYAPLATRMAVEAAMAFTDVIRTRQLDRLRLCAAADCRNVHVDLSKNRSRRFCSTACANRTNVAAYRTRLAGQAR